MKKVFLFSITLLFVMVLAGCEPATPPESPPAPPEPPTEPATAEPAPEPPPAPAAPNPAKRLADILAAQSDEVQARYEYRRPQATLEFFEVRPGMTVVEALPGRGWYSQVLIPYLGGDGRLIGVNYAFDIWPKFNFFDAETIESMRTWSVDWPEQMREQVPNGDDLAAVEAFDFGSMPAHLEGTADVVLFIRALHNLVRFEEDGGYLSTALEETYRVLKPGGIVGVVQHEARPDTPDDWAGGAYGYIKKQLVIDRLTEAGFELVDSSSLLENPDDQPGVDDHVWRLPPTLATSGEDPELRARMEAIGESHRMMLKFRKPE